MRDPFFRAPGRLPRLEPRATRIPITHRDDVDTELWVGGADSDVGERLRPDDVRGAWVIDCAGELPHDLRGAAAAVIMRVFEDAESIPFGYDRIEALARQIAGSMTGAPPNGETPLLPRELPPRLYVICKQGFNRSALVAGRIMRELGAPGAQVVEEIRRRRPGALANEAFVRLLHA